VAISTIIQAAWALLIGRHTNASEATYGVVLAGRNLDLPGLKRVNGPTFTTIPMRVVMKAEQNVEDFLAAIHQVREAMKPHQHVGLQKYVNVPFYLAHSPKIERLGSHPERDAPNLQ
jgi:non-ribosomal peptide synthetase component F